jgi:septum formation protein
MAVVLASGSPRRKELLQTAGVKDFIIAPAEADETIPEGASPGEAVMEIAARKGRAAAKNFGGGDIIIAADTCVSRRQSDWKAEVRVLHETCLPAF